VPFAEVREIVGSGEGEGPPGPCDDLTPPAPPPPECCTDPPPPPPTTNQSHTAVPDVTAKFLCGDGVYAVIT
tara:strand:+ start:651 stop:866 length:216 start_codon:yes stop_codon:yes gene_type:complete